MTELFNLAAYFIQGKPIYPSIRRILNLLFNTSIASFIYEHFYGKYHWYDISDYKRILDFLIKGQFFIPFSIFLVVYGISSFLGKILFYGFTHFRAIRVKRKIIAIQYHKQAIEERIGEVEKYSKLVSPLDLTAAQIVNVYTEIRKNITPEAFKTIEKDLMEPRQALEANFHLFLRGLMAITAYYATIEAFSTWLYIITTVVVIFGLITLAIAYLLLDITPTILRVFHSQAEEYFKQQSTTTQAD